MLASALCTPRAQRLQQAPGAQRLLQSKQWALSPRSLLSPRSHGRGFTLLEMVIALAILALVVTMAAPVLQLQAQRTREADLRQALREIRDGIDAYKRAVDDGRIAKVADKSGYPPTLESLAAGVVNAKDPQGSKIYLLRRIPRDPMHADTRVPAAKTWALRSYASPPDEPREGDDVYDVRSRATGVGINGVPYAKW